MSPLLVTAYVDDSNTPSLRHALRIRRRFRDANPDEIEALTLEGMRTAVMSQLHAGNLEVSIVGDLDPAQLEVCVNNPPDTVSEPC